MTRAKKPVCFVAMAFNRDDTDLLYENQILPVLKRNGIKPVIINRRQSNEDLNVQIIEQLEKSDFCIADLTYARQSVYFEAGFAQRDSEVIYTCRTDHLRRDQPDDRRVHFDLQMKPLVDWKHAEDPRFASRLERRIRASFLREWDRRNRELLKEEDAAEEFAALPLVARLRILRSEAIKALSKKGYKRWSVLSDSRRAKYPAKGIREGVWNHLYSTSTSGQTLQLSTVHAFDSATKVNLKAVGKKVAPWPIEQIMESSFDKAKIVRADHVVLSIRSAPATRIESVFPSFVPIEAPRLYLYSQVIGFPGMRKTPRTEYIQTWHFLTGLRSKPHLVRMLQELLNKRFLYLEIDRA